MRALWRTEAETSARAEEEAEPEGFGGMSRTAKVLRIKLAHLEYEILPATPKHVLYEGSNYGLHSPTDNRIYIYPDQSPAEQVRILCHELIHAIWWAYNIPKKPREEEEICGALETPLAALLRDNTEMLKAIAAAFDGKPIVVDA